MPIGKFSSDDKITDFGDARPDDWGDERRLGEMCCGTTDGPKNSCGGKLSRWHFAVYKLELIENYRNLYMHNGISGNVNL
uniref:Uncharacterized protein n=1 Tax=Romanomermis culicivorax TaxID=13658 RepID=A0A915J699_ROMCU